MLGVLACHSVEVSTIPNFFEVNAQALSLLAFDLLVAAGITAIVWMAASSTKIRKRPKVIVVGAVLCLAFVILAGTVANPEPLFAMKWVDPVASYDALAELAC